MIQKLVDIYDDSSYYVGSNQKKLARDNYKTIFETIVFLGTASLFFITIALLRAGDVRRYGWYIVPFVLLFIFAIIHKPLETYITSSFDYLRFYALFTYGMIILSFSAADAYAYKDSRSMFFAAAILVFSSLYVDHLIIVTAYKFLLIIVFVIIDYNLKGAVYAYSDSAAAFFAIFVSTFTYVTVMRANLESREDNIMLVEKSQTDLLTGLLNKLSFEEECNRVLKDRREGAKATLFIFDFDYFKQVNDRYGHKTGDEVLKLFSKILRDYFHPIDIIGRIGGDEFMVLVMGEMGDDFIEKRCRNILHDLRIAKIGEAVMFSCSIGIAEDSKGHSFAELYNFADNALYQAKSSGKGCFIKTTT